MPRFFFDIETMAGRVQDQAGIDLPDDPALVSVVIELLQYLIEDMAPDRRHGSATVTVWDEDGSFQFEGMISVEPM